ncbi:hypothetical protein SNEBB_009160 [Seison nebaliae]|nr:hypothetical protein SNEBB_009160 [Seison nebaliae]
MSDPSTYPNFNENHSNFINVEAVSTHSLNVNLPSYISLSSISSSSSSSSSSVSSSSLSSCEERTEVTATDIPLISSASLNQYQWKDQPYQHSNKKNKRKKEKVNLSNLSLEMNFQKHQQQLFDEYGRHANVSTMMPTSITSHSILKLGQRLKSRWKKEDITTTSTITTNNYKIKTNHNEIKHIESISQNVVDRTKRKVISPTINFVSTQMNKSTFLSRISKSLHFDQINLNSFISQTPTTTATISSSSLELPNNERLVREYKSKDFLCQCSCDCMSWETYRSLIHEDHKKTHQNANKIESQPTDPTSDYHRNHQNSYSSNQFSDDLQTAADVLTELEEYLPPNTHNEKNRDNILITCEYCNEEFDVNPYDDLGESHSKDDDTQYDLWTCSCCSNECERCTCILSSIIIILPDNSFSNNLTTSLFDTITRYRLERLTPSEVESIAEKQIEMRSKSNTSITENVETVSLKQFEKRFTHLPKSMTFNNDTAKSLILMKDDCPVRISQSMNRSIMMDHTTTSDGTYDSGYGGEMLNLSHSLNDTSMFKDPFNMNGSWKKDGNHSQDQLLHSTKYSIANRKVLCNRCAYDLYELIDEKKTQQFSSTLNKKLFEMITSKKFIYHEFDIETLRNDAGNFGEFELQRKENLLHNISSKNLHQTSIDDLRLMIKQLKNTLQDMNQILVQELAGRDELKNVREEQNRFIDLIHQVQHKKRLMLKEKRRIGNRKNMNEIANGKGRPINDKLLSCQQLTTIIPFHEGLFPLKVEHLQLLIEILNGISIDNENVPQLLTNYILQVVCPSA